MIRASDIKNAKYDAVRNGQKGISSAARTIIIFPEEGFSYQTRRDKKCSDRQVRHCFDETVDTHLPHRDVSFPDWFRCWQTFWFKLASQCWIFKFIKGCIRKLKFPNGEFQEKMSSKVSNESFNLLFLALIYSTARNFIFWLGTKLF